MSRRALAGAYGPAQQDDRKRGKTAKARQTPLDFALAFMRDPSRPDALRAAIAKAALPYLHKRGEEQEKDDAPKRKPMSDLELARRIAHILERGRMEEEKQAAEQAQVEEKAQPAEPARSEGEAAASGAEAAAEPRATAGAPPRSPSANAQPAPCPRDTAQPQRPAWPDDDAAQVGSTRLAPLNDAQLGQARVASQSRDIYPDPHAGYRWIP